MQRNIALDLMKLLMAVCVVFLHTGLFYDVSTLLGHSVVQGLFRLAVPLFLIITGYYFLEINNFKKLKKWICRVFILYVVWMIFYLPLWWTANYSYNFTVVYNGYFVLWYMVSVLYAGLLLFFLKKIGDKYILSLAIILFVIGLILQQIGNMHLFSGFIDWKLNQYPTHRNFLFVSFPFLAIGLLIRKNENLLSKYIKIKLWHVIVVIGLVIAESIANYYFISKKESLDQILCLFLAAPVIFLYCKSLEVLGEGKNIANLSTAIFLIHPLFIYHLKCLYIGKQTLFSIVVLLFSLISAILLVKINKRIKYLL